MSRELIWKNSIKAVVTTAVIVGMVYSPTYYADDPMQSNYAWIWGALILYAIWTRKKRPVVKSIASFGPIVIVGATAYGVISGASNWLAIVGFLLLGTMVLLAIWIRRPEKEGASISDADYYAVREDDSKRSQS